MMHCDEAQQLLRSGDRELAEVAEHVRTCPVCAMSHQLAAQPAPPDEVIDALLEQTQTVIERERRIGARLKSLPTWARLLIGSAAAVLIVGAVAIFNTRVDIAVYPLARLVGEAAALGLPMLLLIFIVLRPIHRPAYPTWATRGAAIGAAAVVALVAGLPAAHMAHPASLEGVGDDFVPRALGCLMFGSIVAAPALVLLAAMDRAISGWHRPIAVAAVAAGAAGNLALLFHCPLVSPAHQIAGHATVVGLLLAAGAVAMKVRAR